MMCIPLSIVFSIESILSPDVLAEIISCVFTILALVFTLYFWLLDQISDDESKFIEGKESFLKDLNSSMEIIKSNRDPEALLQMVQNVNNKLEVILNYKFWAHGKKKEDYKKITEFYADSKYLISTIRRYVEHKNGGSSKSLVGIEELKQDALEDIQSDYGNGLMFIIDFIENWN